MPSEMINNAVSSARDSLSKQNGTDLLSPRQEEYQYLDLVRDILDHGEHRPDR